MEILCLTHGTINYEADRQWYHALKKIGSVEYYDYVKNDKKLGSEKNNLEIIRIVQARRFKVCFFFTYVNLVANSTLDQIRKTGCKVIAWFSDDNTKFDNYSVFYAPHLDLSLTTYRSSYQKYLALNLPVMLARWAANPDYYIKKDLPKTIAVSFIGQQYGVRKVLYDRLCSFMQERGLGRCVFKGKGWSERISFDDFIDTINASKINLDISNDYRQSTENQIKGRVAEVTMCGGFLLTGYHHELNEMFDVDKEIQCYHDTDEMLEKNRILSPT